jgi:hypothetical protein
MSLLGFNINYKQLYNPLHRVLACHPKRKKSSMSRIDEVASLICQDHSLLEIQQELVVSMSSVGQYLNSAIGAGLIKGSDVIFSIPPHERELIETIIQATNSTTWYDIIKYVKTNGYSLDSDILKIYLKFRNERVQMKDMYEYISIIELTLHQAIKAVLLGNYGPEGWWRQGIPMTIRKVCAELMEEDSEPAKEPYCYTNFIHLQEILDKQWVLFSSYLPIIAVKDKKEFLRYFTKLNHIRNSVMHPAKDIPLSENDFSLVREFCKTIQPSNWQIFPK